MRPRHMLMLALLAAVPVALAVLLTGGGGPPAATGGGAQVSLQLTQPRAKATLVACGVTHHYDAYPAGATITFRGDVSARAGWTVHLKLKACAAGVFEPAGDVRIHGHTATAYHGAFAAPTPGSYYARAEVLERGALVARSRKRFFVVR